MGKPDNTNNYKRRCQGKLTFVDRFHLKVEASSLTVLRSLFFVRELAENIFGMSSFL